MSTPNGHPRREVVVVCGNTDWQANPLAARPLADALARYVTVLWVDPPISVLTARNHPERAASLEGARLRVAAPNVVRLTPLVLPGKDRALMHRLTTTKLRASIARAARVLHADVRALIATAPNLDPLGAAHERSSVYWVHDDYASDPDLVGIDAQMLARGQRRLAARADLVLAASPTLVETFTPLSPTLPRLFPNACSVPAVTGPDAAPPSGIELTQPFAIYAGRLGPRVDLNLLIAVADGGAPLLLVGPRDPGWGGAAFDELVARPDVQWCGEVPARDLPAYLASARVGVVPYADRPFNRASFPLKVLEYLAVGLPVVSTPLPAMEWFPARWVATTNDASFGAAVTATVRAPIDRRAAADRRVFAAQHTWDARAVSLLEWTSDA